MAIATAGAVPVSPVKSAVTCGTFVSLNCPAKTMFMVTLPRFTVCAVVQGDAPQCTMMSSGPRLSSPSSAASTAAPVALYAIGAVVWPSHVSVKVPPVAPLTRTVCHSSVFMSLNGPKPPELPPPAGVSSPVTSQRLLSSSKSMSPPTWQHAPRSTWTFMIFCSDARSSDGFSPSTNLKRESWK